MFVQESLETDWQWSRVRLLGGEPTLHPQFAEVVKLLLKYRRLVPACFLQVLTNGQGKAEKYRTWLHSESVSLHAEAKERGIDPPWFNNTRIAPVDRDPDVGELPPCGIFGEVGCGIGLTRHGYFLDGAGAAVARVAGYDVGVMRLADVTWESMLEQSKVLCRMCGHWNPMSGEHVTELVTKTGKVTGRFWAEKLAQPRAKLSVYGGSA